MRRTTILRLAKKLLITQNDVSYMCISLKLALNSKGFIYGMVNLEKMFPEFNIKTAKEKFNAFIENESFNEAWWPYEDKEDRIAYFDYLINFYKDDKIDIKKEFKQWLI